MIAAHVHSEPYRFQLEFLAGDRPEAHVVRLAPRDFERAVWSGCFDAVCRQAIKGFDPGAYPARIEPRFTGDSPLTSGFRVVHTLPGSEHVTDFDLSFFQSRANRVRSELVRDKKIPDDANLSYRLTACLTGDDVRPGNACGIAIESESSEVPIRPGQAVGTVKAVAWDDPSADAMTVFIRRRVLEEVVTDACSHPEREIGGVLLGHLRRDPDGVVYLEVTCQVPAEGTEATSTSVTFTPAVWQQAREVAALRGEGEIFVGWAHSHPFRLCATCPSSPPPECVAKVLFYSADDEFLMELSFAQPFMVGLLAGVDSRLDAALGHLPVKLFGWRNGEIQPRGFHVIEE